MHNLSMSTRERYLRTRTHVCQFCLRSCISCLCKVQVAVGIGSEVLVLGLCTSFLMSVVVGSLCCK